MSKGKKRSNREIRKPKTAKLAASAVQPRLEQGLPSPVSTIPKKKG